MRKSNAIRTIGVAIGVAVCLVGAALMVWGHPILGEDHTGIATVVGIVGLGIITSSNSYVLALRRKEGL
jgi:O-antigen/teichoic acid export membrane protein